MLCTPLCRTLGIREPIFSAGIGAAAGAELAAAVSNAGGLGVLGTASLPARFVRLQIARFRELSDRPFGVNVVLPLLRRGTIEACLDEHVPVLVLFWGEAGELRSIIANAHRQNTRVFVQVGSRDEAQVAVEAGADGVIAQGWEAGGHVRGTTALSVLVPTVADAIAPVPVIAAGGVADGRTLLAALCLGAQAVSMGTRFLASEEANADLGYKQRVVSATPKTPFALSCSTEGGNELRTGFSATNSFGHGRRLGARTLALAHEKGRFSGRCRAEGRRSRFQPTRPTCPSPA